MTVTIPVGIRLISSLFYSLRIRTKHRLLGHKIFIGVFTFIVYTAYHMSRKPLSVVKNVLHQNETNGTFSWKPFDGSNYQMLLGVLDYAFLFSYTFSIFISGFLAERLNLRYYLSSGMVLSGLATMAFGFGYFGNIHILAYYVIIQIVAGSMSATGWPSVVAIMSNWFGKGRRGLIMTVWNMHTSLGNIVGSLIAGAFVTTIWGWSFAIPGIIIASIGVFCFFLLVPDPTHLGFTAAKQHLEEKNTPETPLINNSDSSQSSTSDKNAISIYDALKIPGVIEYSFGLFFCKMVSYTLLYWLPQYIFTTAKYDPSKSADISTLFDIGGILGGILAGVIFDSTGLSAIICFVMLGLASPFIQLYRIYGSESFALTVVLLILSGSVINGPYALITTAVAADLGNHKQLTNTHAVATVAAIIDGTGSLGAALGPMITGLIVSYGWYNVFSMLVIANILGILCLSRLIYREARTFIWRRRNVISEYEVDP